MKTMIAVNAVVLRSKFFIGGQQSDPRAAFWEHIAAPLNWKTPGDVKKRRPQLCLRDNNGAV